MAKGIVYLIGAGPGDPRLITVKGRECIQEADVVVYDRLASPRLLSWARTDAEKIYVGKSPDRHTLKQDEINQLLVEKASEGKIIARLKGGDPFVFGRGGEEAETLAEAGITFEVIPGITSAISVPAYAGIPVTHRGITSNVGIITGNEDPTKEDSSIAWNKISTGLGTLVFLMGMGNLPKITQKLIENGRSPETPVALIRWGTRPEQATLTGKLADIVQKSQEAQFKNPAIIVVGEVVNLRDKLKWFESKPFFGRRIVVTRSRAQASSLSEAIERLGGEAWEFPAIMTKPPEDWRPLDKALNEIEEYQWIIFTSVNGVKFFFRRLREINADVRQLAGIKLCAIGPKTREALEEKGLRVELTPGEYRAEAVLEELKKEQVIGNKFLLPRADIARPILAKELEKLGAVVEEVTAYRTVRGEGNAGQLQQLLEERAIHAVTFTSSSTVKNFIEAVGISKLDNLLQEVTLACIGPITADTLKGYGFEPEIVAEEYTIDGLINAMLQHFANM